MKLFWPFILLTFLLFAANGKAEHIIGGEFSYVCLGDDTYQFTLSIYRDCYSPGADFDAPAAIGIYTSNNVYYGTEYVNPSSVNSIQPDFGADCITFPPDICVEEGVYSFSLDLPSNDIGYKVVYQRCCRNQTILNLNNPGAQGLTIVAEIPPENQVVCNSSPVFNNFPPIVICAQQELIFDHSATEVDGDSLVYELCSPFIGASQDIPLTDPPTAPPYSTVNWGTGFSADDPVTANPGLSIDPQTGLITGTPTQIGQFVVGVCVSEYRDGVLVSTNRRDFQFNITTCLFETQASIAEIEPADLCSGLTINFGNDSDPSNDFLWDFGVEGTTTDVSAQFAPSYTFPDTGTYFVTLITNPGMDCSDTNVVEVPLYYDFSVGFDDPNVICVNDQLLYSFESNGQFDLNEFEVTWDFGENASPQNANGPAQSDITFSQTGAQIVTVSIFNQGCTGSYTDTIIVPEPIVAAIDPQEDFCTGLALIFSQTNINATNYLWDFGVPGTEEDVSQLPSANYTFPEMGTYTVSLTASSANRCPVTVTEIFEVRPLLDPFFEMPPIECFDENSIDFEAGGTLGTNTSFQWSFENGFPQTSNSANPQDISFDSLGIHLVSLTIEDYGCTKSYESQVEIHPNPLAIFDAREYEGCAPFETKFLNHSISASDEIEYEWNLGDGNTSGSKSPLHIFQDPGFYSVSLTIRNKDGCIDTSSHAIDAFIKVNPTPKAGFRLNPSVVSIIEPILNVIDLSEGADYCRVTFGDEVVENDCSFTYELQNPEPMEVVQYVENEFGCWDETGATLKISDHLIFIPNAFTPDNDGLNDVFIPVTSGVISMEMSIYDRWGNRVWFSNDLNEGWRGQSINNPDYYIGTGIYQYLIDIKDNLGWNHIYQGDIRLIR